MRKFLLFLPITLFVSCISYSPVVNFIDYSQYNDQGMFLTESNSVNFDYQPVGSIQVLLYSWYYKDGGSSRENKDFDPVYSPQSRHKVSFENTTVQEALKMAVQQAEAKGANAIINLKYEYVPAHKNTPEGWFVSGMAVKR